MAADLHFQVCAQHVKKHILRLATKLPLEVRLQKFLHLGQQPNYDNLHSNHCHRLAPPSRQALHHVQFQEQL